MAGNLDHKRAAAAVPPSTRRPAQASYRDDPDALSMHTTPDDYDYDGVPELPSYSDSIAADNAPPVPNNARPHAADEYQAISQPSLGARTYTIGRGGNTNCSQKVSAGSETSIRMDERLMESNELFEYITNYLRVVPPRPMVRVQGWHWEQRRKNDNKKEKERAYDFDVVLSLQGFLPKANDDTFWVPDTVENSDKSHRGGFTKSRAPGYIRDIEVGGAAKKDLREWCDDFCSIKSALRIFRVSRKVTGLDMDYLKAQIEPLVRSTHYRGHIDMTFPCSDQNVDIYSPHWVNRARISWVRWLFYLTFLWLITWPILFFLTKKWSVYNINWRYSMMLHDSQHPQNEPWKVYATLSEKDWLERHANLIRSLVLDKFHGDATEMPTDVQVDLERRRAEVRVPQVQLGGGAMRNAMGLLQGGVSVWNQVNGRGDMGWGADES